MAIGILANRGCCQQSETTNICMDEEYPGGACVPLAGRTIDCAAGHWNPNAQYSQGAVSGACRI